METITGDTVERVKTGAHDVVDRVAEATNRVADSINVKTEQMKDAEERLMEQARKYVRENPVASVGIAVAGGFILSRLMSRR